MTIPSNYNLSNQKRMFDIVISFILTILFLPLFIIIALLNIFLEGYPVFFIQRRAGKNGIIFKILKFRSMKISSEKKRIKILNLNEADGPVFKIRNDPRFTKFGKLLSRTGLDELPQLINVIKGNMSLVGPRPLPLYEFEKLSKKQRIRNVVKPGVASLWVVNGSHNLSFNEWMKLDKKYIKEANPLMDIQIILKTSLIPIKAFVNYVFNNK